MRAEQARWSLDTVLVRWREDGSELLRATSLRAAAQLDTLPAGLEEFWRGTLPLDPLDDR